MVMAAPSVRAESPPFETTWSFRLEGCQVNPAVTSSASGNAVLQLPNFGSNDLTYSVAFGGLTGTAGEVHLHAPASRGATAPVLATLTITSSGQASGTLTLTAEQRLQVEGGRAYVDVHSTGFPDGELRGQVDFQGSACPPPTDAGVPDAGTAGADAGDGADRGGGCAAGGSGGLGAVVLALGALLGAARRRRR